MVVWNSVDKLDQTLAALTRQTYAATRLVVVDNASHDNSVPLVKSYFPNAILICNESNRGYCGGHNQAIASSDTDYYLPFNPDVVIESDFIAALVDTIKTRPDIGSVTGKLLQRRDTDDFSFIDTTGLFINRQRRQYLRGHGTQDVGQYASAEEVFGVDGAAPLYRRSMLESIKIDGQYFDESFFAHKEDVDIAWRARIAGWRAWYTPQALALHPRSFKPGHRTTMSPIIRLHAVKNRYLLLLRNETKPGMLRDGVPILWYDLRILAYLCLFERTSLPAFSMVRQLWPRIQEWRKQIWQNAKVSPGELLKWFR
jgi:GT2 family glycosyltransferase